MSSSIYSASLRLSGLSSGMDTDSIVESLMKIEQLKVNRELRAYTLLEWKKEQLTQVSTDIKDFKNTFLTSRISSTNMLSSSAYIQFKVSTTNTTNAVTVAAGTNNTASSVVINKVEKLASAAKVQSAVGADNRGSVFTEDLAEGNYIALEDLKFTNELQFDSLGNFSIEINGEKFTFNKSDNLQNMMNTINKNENANVTLSFSRLSNTFSLTAKGTGADSELTFSNVTGNFFGAGGASQLESSDIVAGENAVVYINDVRVEKSSNSFTIDGISYTLNKVTEAGADPIEFTIAKDIDSAVERIKGFIEGYNTMITKLQTMVNERKSASERSYTPLTDEEKAAMTEEQVKTWEELAKKGLFYNDTGINSVLSALRNAVYETVEGVGMSAYSLGISTTSYYSGKLGEIELNEDVLRAALEKDADQVMRTFMNIPSGGDELDDAEKYKQSGWLYKIQTVLDNYTKGSQKDTLDGFTTKMSNLGDRISRLESKMAELAERYYQKFAAMETALAQLESQSQSVVNLLGTSSNAKK